MLVTAFGSTNQTFGKYFRFNTLQQNAHPMTTSTLLITAIISILLLVVEWLWLNTRFTAQKQQTLQSLSQASAELDKQNALYISEKTGLLQQLTEKSNDLLLAEQQNKELQNQLSSEIEMRASAEAKAERLPIIEQELHAKNVEFNNMHTQLTALEERLSSEKQKLEQMNVFIEESKENLLNSFKVASHDALQQNSTHFLESVAVHLQKFSEGTKTELDHNQKALQNLVSPLSESLQSMQNKVQDIEKSRAEAYGKLNTQIESLLSQSIPNLQKETSKLVDALRKPQTRGRWGEIQLKRVVEMAGMLEYCDFEEQVSGQQDGNILRPDLVVKMPGGRRIVVDSKAPLEAYLQSIDTPSEDERKKKLDQHARVVRDHIKKLGEKNYWEQFKTFSPEFVVLFLPGESFYQSALESDPTLIEYGVEKKVIPATPTTLIALLRAVEYGWRQEVQNQKAQEIAELGKELYKRLSALLEHWDDVRKSLEKTVTSYNKAAGSWERSVAPQLRKFQDLKVSRDESPLKLPEPIESSPREIGRTDA